jgi:hypothetical protein
MEETTPMQAGAPQPVQGTAADAATPLAGATAMAASVPLVATLGAATLAATAAAATVATAAALGADMLGAGAPSDEPAPEPGAEDATPKGGEAT